MRESAEEERREKLRVRVRLPVYCSYSYDPNGDRVPKISIRIENSNSF